MSSQLKYRIGCAALVLFVAFVGLNGWRSRTNVRNYRSPAMISQSNLHNIVVATLNYEISMKQLLMSGSIAPTAPASERHGWQSHLLPELEQKSLHSSIDYTRAWDDPVNLPHTGTSIDEYRNPNVPRPWFPAENDASLTHYAGNVHVLPAGPALRLSDITDGDSQTILLGEVVSEFQPWAAPGNVRDPALGINADSHGFGGPSKHGGASFGFLDGKVSFLNENIDPAVLRAIATPAGGETVKWP
jgi:hypothetical protein